MAIVDKNTENQQLPAILCLHGAGTNSTIFRLQARMIIRRLAAQFRFIFVDAPFESLPGPGVVPTYVGLQPYLWWHCDESAADGFDITLEEVRRKREKVWQLLAAHLQDPAIVGVMAFSQGARVATGLCLDSVLGERIKFAILIAATFPALTISDNTSSAITTAAESSNIPNTARQMYNVEEKNKNEITITAYDTSSDDSNSSSHSNASIDDDDREEGSERSLYRSSSPSHQNTTKLTIPSIHIQGVSDPWLSEGTRLHQTYFDQDQTTIVSFSGGHTVPVAKKDVDKVTLAIASVWEGTRSAK